MNSLDDLPRRAKSHDTAEAAETEFRAAINSYEFFVIQGEDRNDYGTDIQIEARDINSMTNIRAQIQLKGTEATANVNGSVSVSVARTNLNYLLAQPNSIYICYHVPSKRLLVRFADDVYSEYQHRGSEWHHQESITINLRQLFDEEFQRSFSSRLLASGRSSRDRRLQWAVTPPEKISVFIEQAPPTIEVPANPAQAKVILTELYNTGHDDAISSSFAQFAATFGSIPGAMDMAYMAEINLGINGLTFDKDRVREGILKLDEAIGRSEIHPGSLLYCIGNGYLSLKKYENARQTYKQALAELTSPELEYVASQCYKNLGSVLEELGEMDGARDCYEQALALYPDLGEAHLALALWHRKKGKDLTLALAHLDEASSPENSGLEMSTVHGWRMELLFRLGDANAAFREINNLISQTNQFDWVWPWCARQVSYWGKSSTEAVRKSLVFWRAYRREYPVDLRAEREVLLCNWHMRMAGENLDIEFSQFKAAVLELIDSGDPDEAFLWDRLGHWAQEEGDWHEAEKAYRKAFELEPEQYGYCLGTALNFLNRYSEALPLLLSQAEEHQPDALSWFQVAVAREGINDIAGSVKAYHQAIELDSDYDLAWFNLGGVYWNSGDAEQGKEIWCEAIRRFPEHELIKKLLRKFPVLSKKDCNGRGQ